MGDLMIHPVIKKILESRGYTEEQMAEYLSPRPQLTYDPFLMKGMEEATEIIIRYAKEKRKICVFGDYDCDGISSVTLMMCVLKELTDNLFYYIPSRFEEGYGLNISAVDKIHQQGAELIITVDCGSVSYNEVEYIKEKGMAVIVTDHHNIDDRSADCIILNPKQQDDTYPFSYLCGCGVAFKLAQAISRRTEFSKASLNALLDLVGIATIGDIVPLIDENRTLVKYGIDRIKRQQRKSLNGLMDEISVQAASINTYNIAFGIVPHLNSCGRMATADMGVELLLSQDDKHISELSAKLAELNYQRRSIQQEIYKTAADYIDNYMHEDLFILYDAGSSHEGITGIVAGKLKEDYNRPVIIVTEAEDPDKAKGTGRSIEGIDLYKLLKGHEELFLKFGGHAGACGFTMEKKDVGLLRRLLNEDMKGILAENPDVLAHKVKTDAVIDADDVTLELANQVKLMEPFGAFNEQPLFSVENVHIKRIFAMGKEKQYRKLSCVSKSGRTFDAVIFDEKLIGEADLLAGKTVKMAAEININTWNGRSSVQTVVRSFI